MDKKSRAHRRNASTSSSSSSSSSCSSSSSSSYDHRRSGGRPRSRGKKESPYKRESRQVRLVKRKSSGSGERVKSRKSKNSSKHSSSKGTSRKSSHGSRRDYKDYDQHHLMKSSKSPLRYYKTSSRKVHSPLHTSSSRKSRKQSSPSPYKKGYKTSVSPHEKMDYYPRGLDHHSLRHSSRDLSPGPIPRSKDPRIEERYNRSPDHYGRERYMVHDSPKRYERDEYSERDRRDKRLSPPSSSLRMKEDRKDGHKQRDYQYHDRSSYEEPIREDPRRAADRDPREKKVLRERDRIEEDDDKRGRFRREGEYSRSRGRDYPPERDFYPRPPIDSRESSIERCYDDPYSKYSEGERPHYESRPGYDEIGPPHERRPPPDFSPREEIRYMEERRARPPLPPIDPRFHDERRKRESSLERVQDAGWSDRSRLDAFPDKPDVYSSIHPHSSGVSHRRAAEWVDPRTHSRPPPHSEAMVDKYLIKTRRPEAWPPTEEYPVPEWEDERSWPPEKRERLRHHHHPAAPPHVKEWGTLPPPRRYAGPWDEAERGEWPGSTLQDRLGIRGPLPKAGLPPGHHSLPRDSLATTRPRVLPPRSELEFHEHERGLPLELARSGEVVMVPEVKGPPLSVPAHMHVPPSQMDKPIIEKPVVLPPSTPVSNLGQPEVEVPRLEKDNFSDFSDDSDDILNQDVEIENNKEQKDISATENVLENNAEREVPSFEDILDEEERMELEEISDEEFEEDKPVKFSVTDALDINWSALISESRTCPSPSHGSALKRFRPLNLLASLGVSTKYARPHVLQKVTDECLRIEKFKNEAEIQAEKPESNETDVNMTRDGTKDEDEISEDKEETSHTKSHSEEDKKAAAMPVIHPVVVPEGVVRCLQERSLSRLNLLCLRGPKKVLSAREDLAIRRRLCELPNDEIEVETAVFDVTLSKQAVQNFLSYTPVVY